MADQEALSECSQETCSKPAEYRYAWPGNPMAYACKEHAARLCEVARAMGFLLTIEELEK